ncbi:type VII secretion-associated serine protease mycosin [Streptacidiphilus monticola]|uniref:Type VII secretion-associated serine protease mycosin n=1 Tax=Streptacidiphilus monticola TaxID=2161674 RepID=A0ABW1G000_9ACTN
MSRAVSRAAAAAAALALGALGGVGAGAVPAYASSGQCTFPAQDIPGTPWALQRVLLPQLHQKATGKGVTVAVIDTGVDATNPQLAGAVTAGPTLLKDAQGNALTDPVGHGTMVAGIIAARAIPSTGFVGIAPQARILSIRQNDGQGNGTQSDLARAVDYARTHGAGVINISQDVSSNGKPVALPESSELGQAVKRAVAAGIVVVASAGNEGLPLPTYPASFPGVLGVGASDRNDERAESFSESGTSVGVAAPGVDIVSTVPKRGQCVDSGTSFAAPYVAGVAALLKQMYPHWTPAQIIARIEQTAQRTDPGRNDQIGWGVVDPVAAVSDTSAPEDAPTPTPQGPRAAAPVKPRPLAPGETQADRDRRTAFYAVGIAALLVLLVTGTATVLRDARRRQAL